VAFHGSTPEYTKQGVERDVRMQKLELLRALAAVVVVVVVVEVRLGAHTIVSPTEMLAVEQPSSRVILMV
jgi:hypothetical protein